MDAELGSYGFRENNSRIEVLDLAADEQGNLTRFDIVFELTDSTPEENVFGELRMNEPSPLPALSATAEHLHWPQVRTTGPTVPARDEFRNTTGEPLAIGAVRVRGDASRDFSIGDDACSGRTLAPGADCAVIVDYRPTRPGPRVATLSVQTDQGTLPVDLTGSTPLGVSSVTTSGDDYIDHGLRHTISPLIVFGLGPFVPSAIDPDPPAHTYRWEEDPAFAKPPGTGLGLTLTSQVGPVRLGRQRVSTYRPTNVLLGYGTYAGDCRGYAGTIDVRAFRVDEEDQPTLARIDFTEKCRPPAPDVDPWGTITGHLRVQDRKDVTAPAAPTHLTVSGRTVRWRSSKAKDLRTTVVRVSTGGRATPTTGYPLSAGRATSATLPELRPGQRYTVTAFSVDRTGNVSRARTRTFVA